MKGLKRLVKKVKSLGCTDEHQCCYVEKYLRVEPLLQKPKPEYASPKKPPRGYLAVYVGEERERLFLPMSYLSHPLFRILLEKVREEYGYQRQDHGLLIPCSVESFHEVVSAIEASHGTFDMQKLLAQRIGIV